MSRDRDRRRRRRRRRIRSVLLVVLLIAGVVVAEGALRALDVGRHAAPPAFDLRLRTPQADFDRGEPPAAEPAQPEARLRTDARGYVAPVSPGVAAAPPVSIAFLGGSTTQCRGLRSDQRFPALVAALLAARGYHAETLNGGRAGATIRDGLTVLADRLAQDGADHVVWMEAANDAAVLARDGAYAERSSTKPDLHDVVRWGAARAGHVSALAGYGLARLLPAVGVPLDRPWPAPAELAKPALREPYRTRIEAFVALARALGIQPWLATHPLGYADADRLPWVDAAEQEAFNGEVRAAAAALGVPLVDLAARVAAEPDAARAGALFTDGLHVTERGARLYAETFAEALAAKLVAPPVEEPQVEAPPPQGAAEPAFDVEAEDPTDPEAAPEE